MWYYKKVNGHHFTTTSPILLFKGRDSGAILFSWGPQQPGTGKQSPAWHSVWRTSHLPPVLWLNWGVNKCSGRFKKTAGVFNSWQKRLRFYIHPQYHLVNFYLRNKLGQRSQRRKKKTLRWGAPTCILAHVTSHGAPNVHVDVWPCVCLEEVLRAL